MKKKKLKKRIKKLERKIQWLNDCERTLALRCDKLYHNDMKTKDDISKLKDSKFCNDDIKGLTDRIRTLSIKIDDIYMDVNSLRSNIEKINGRCDILDRRTQTDYDKIVPKTEETKNEKTCDTCKWEPLLEQGGQDIPCMGCTDTDKKMWKSKEA